MTSFALSFIWISLSSYFFTVFFVARLGKQSALLDETVVGLLGLFAVLFKLSRVACVDAEMSARRPLGQQLCSMGRDFFSNWDLGRLYKLTSRCSMSPLLLGDTGTCLGHILSALTSAFPMWVSALMDDCTIVGVAGLAECALTTVHENHRAVGIIYAHRIHPAVWRLEQTCYRTGPRWDVLIRTRGWMIAAVACRFLCRTVACPLSLYFKEGSVCVCIAMASSWRPWWLLG